MPKIIFVCTGNTCRSPMAEQILIKTLEDNNLAKEWEISSAGIAALKGNKASQQAIEVLAEEGLDLRQHQSKQLDQDLAAAADLILTMTEDHKRAVQDIISKTRAKVFTLKEFASSNGNLNISDPFGQSIEVYRQTREEIKETIIKMLGRMNQFFTKAGKSTPVENNYKRGGIKLNVAIACDHAGIDIKKEIINYLEEEGHSYQDMGTNALDSVDYPDFAYPVASAVAKGEFERGILICGTGIGMSIAANKVQGIRAALCHDVFSAKATRNHNNTNVLAMGSRVIGAGLALEIVKTWLDEEFDGGRHQRRIGKIDLIERGEYSTNE